MGYLKDLITATKEKTEEYRKATKSIEDFVSGAVLPFQTTSGQGIRPRFDKHSLVLKYQSWAYSAANRNAAAISKVPLRLFSTRSTGEQQSGHRFGNKIGRPVSLAQRKYLKSIPWLQNSPRFKAHKEIEEIEEHPFLTLMQNVNPHFNQTETMLQLSLYLDNTGDNFWHLVFNSMGIPIEFWTLPSQLVTVIPDEKKFIKGYLYGRRAGSRVKFSPEQVVKFTRPHLIDPWNGMSRIEGAFWAIVGHDAMERFEANLFEMRGLKEILIKYKSGSLNTKQRRDLIREWSHAIDTASIQRAPLVADGDFDITPMQWTPREMTMLGGREWRKEEIIIAYGQHPAMYTKNANTANIQGAIFLWEEYEVTPTLHLIEQKINEQLIPHYNEPRLFVAFDQIVKQDKEFDLKQQESDLENSVMSINEIRERRGLEPVAWGDVPLVSQTIIPLGSTPVPPGSSNGSEHNDDKKSHIDMLLPSFSHRSTGSPSDHSKHVHCGHGFCMTVKQDDTVDIDRTGGPNPAIDTREQQLVRQMGIVWAAQAPLAVREAAKAAAADFSFIASQEWAEEIFKLSHGLLGEWMVVGGKLGADKMGIELIDFTSRQNVVDALRNHTFDFARAVNKRSETILREQMIAGVTKGESIAQLTKRIETTTDAWKGFRAERVARTESARAVMIGQEAQWAETGVVSGKKWDANNDACPFCLEMDGKIIELNTPFWQVSGPNQDVEFEDRTITLKHEYLDVLGPPLHPNSYDSETEIYTHEGWVFVDKLKVGDKCFSFYPFDGLSGLMMARFQKVIRTYHHKTKDWVEFASDDVSLKVTADHNMAILKYRLGSPSVSFEKASHLANGETWFALIAAQETKKAQDFWYKLIGCYDMSVHHVTEEAEQDAYCDDIEEWHTLLTRRNGKIAWSGNCRCDLQAVIVES